MPHFIGVEGFQGAGKTLNASLMAHYWKQAAGGAPRLFANFELKGAELFDNYERWYDVADALGSICLWDEAGLQFDRRQWARNTTETQLFNMTRKLRTVHMFITPVINTLDGRILDFIEVLIHVRRRENYGVWLDFYDYQTRYLYGGRGRHLKTKFLPEKNLRKLWKMQLYDTYQMVYPFSVPTTERQQTAFLKEIQERHRMALERERKGIELPEVDLDDWYTKSDYQREKGERPEEPSLFVPEHVGG